MTKTELRDLRKSIGCMQEAFANLVGVHPVTMRRWETEETKSGAVSMRGTTEQLIRMLVAQERQRQRKGSRR